MMQENKIKQSNKPEKTAESVFAKEKTYGERKYQFIFGTVINFWVNLIASAGFTFWASHSTTKINLPFTEAARAPREYMSMLAQWLEKQPVMKLIENPVTRAERSRSLSTLFALLTPGHFVMIPSVWLGSKFKSQIVNYFDRKHYGDDAMENAISLKARHEAIEYEDKPTLLGAVVGRIGAFFATQTVGFLIGTPDNFANKVGFKKFTGVDPIATKFGTAIGDGVHTIAPKAAEKIEQHFVNKQFSWSEQQLHKPEMQSLIGTTYKQSIGDFSRYVTTDVLYTLTTAVSVNPIINFVKKFIPGLVYKTKKPIEQQAPVRNRTVFTDATLAPSANDSEPAILDAPATAPEKPSHHVMDVGHESTISTAPDLQVAGAGA